jgi:hypothetical protein
LFVLPILNLQDFFVSTHSRIFHVDTSLSPISCSSGRLLPGYLKQETVQALWEAAPNTAQGSGESRHEYGLGWAVKRRENLHAFCKDQKFYASHTGGAIGASSVLLIGEHSFFSFVLTANRGQQCPPLGEQFF